VGTTPILSAPQTAGGLPVINAACAVVTSYLRSQPTRILYPTEIFRLQSASIREHLAMNGDFRYTNANMNLPNYYDSYQGLNGTTRSLTYTANASQACGDCGRLWHGVAGDEDVQPLRSGGLLERAPTGNGDHDQR
jgi:hypothetical protein